MKNAVADFIKKLRIVLSETLSSFQKNNDLSAASSLAFSATLAPRSVSAHLSARSGDRVIGAGAGEDAGPAHPDSPRLQQIPEGKSFGELSFLLSSPRSATAVALDDVELVVVNSENINNLMNEYLEFVIELLRDMARRLREANTLTD